MDGKNVRGKIIQSCPRFYSLSLIEQGLQARLIFGVIQTGNSYVLKFIVSDQVRKITGYDTK